MKIHIYSEPRRMVWTISQCREACPPSVELMNTPPAESPVPAEHPSIVSNPPCEVLLLDAADPATAVKWMEFATIWLGASRQGRRRMVVLIDGPDASGIPESFPLRIRSPFLSPAKDGIRLDDIQAWWTDLLALVKEGDAGTSSAAGASEAPALRPSSTEDATVPGAGDHPGIPTRTDAGDRDEAQAQAGGGSAPPNPPAPDAADSPGWTCQPMRLLYGIGAKDQRITASMPPAGKIAESDLSNLLVSLFLADKVEEGCTVAGFTTDGRLRLIRVLGRSELSSRTTLNAVTWILPPELPAALRCRPQIIIGRLKAEAASLQGAMPSESELRLAVRFPLAAPTAQEINGALERLIALPQQHLGALFHQLLWRHERVAWFSNDSEPDRLRFLDDLHLVLPPALWNGITWTTDYHRQSPTSVHLGVLPERRRSEGTGCLQINPADTSDPRVHRGASEESVRQLQAFLTHPGLADALALLWKHALPVSLGGTHANAWTEWRSAASHLATLTTHRNWTAEDLTDVLQGTNRLSRCVLAAEPQLLHGAWEHYWRSASRLEHWIFWLKSAPSTITPCTETPLLQRMEAVYRDTESKELRRLFLQLWEQRGGPMSFAETLKARDRQRIRDSLTTARQWIEWLEKAVQNELNEITRKEHGRIAVALRREERMTLRTRLVELASSKIDDALLHEHLQILQDTYRGLADVSTLAGMFRAPNVHLKDLEDPVTRAFVSLFEREQDGNVQAAALIVIGTHPQLHDLHARLRNIYDSRQRSVEAGPAKPPAKGWWPWKG